MTSDADKHGYEARVSRVVAYIFDHLEEELDLNRLAEIACLSPYHWHRVYCAMRGETVAATVKRLRLDRAAADLALTATAIAAIARRSGYANVQSFTRIFKSVYGMPPATYRKKGSHAQFDAAHHQRSKAMYDLRIETLPNMTAVTVAHRGSYMEINRAFDRLFGWLAARNLLGTDLRSLAIFYDEVASVPTEQLRSRAGVVTPRRFAIEAPLERTEIAGGD